MDDLASARHHGDCARDVAGGDSALDHLRDPLQPFGREPDVLGSRRGRRSGNDHHRRGGHGERGKYTLHSSLLRGGLSTSWRRIRRMAKKKTYGLLAALAVAACVLPAAAQEMLPADVRAAIDKAAAEVLQTTGAPSASIAVVTGGKIAYVNTYGRASIDPPVDATTEMRYSIGSISKQFTAAAILLLV